MQIKSAFFSLLLLTSLGTVGFAQNIQRDFQQVAGCWQGTLTYLDYTSNKPFSMPANLQVTQVDSSDRFTFENTYPNEPRANGSDTIRISAGGKTIADEKVVSRKTLKDGSTEIISEKQGTDGNDNKAARFRYTYILGKDTYLQRKEVNFEKKSSWIMRHEFKYHRCK